MVKQFRHLIGDALEQLRMLDIYIYTWKSPYTYRKL